jgi:hypothetical protein
LKGDYRVLPRISPRLLRSFTAQFCVHFPAKEIEAGLGRSGKGGGRGEAAAWEIWGGVGGSEGAAKSGSAGLKGVSEERGGWWGGGRGGGGHALTEIILEAPEATTQSALRAAAAP